MTRRLAARLAVLVSVVGGLGLSAGGCIGIPFVSPPMRVELNVGPGGGTLQPAAGLPAESTDVTTIMGGHFGIYPASFFEEQLFRSWDAGLGYVVEGNINGNQPRPPTMHGLYVDGSYWFVTDPVGDDGVLRFGLLGRGDVRWAVAPEQTTEVGGSAFFGVQLDFARWVGGEAFSNESQDEDGKSSMLLGTAYGEGGLGFSVGASYNRVGPQEYWAALFNLTFRLPATAGIFIKSL